MTYEQAKEYVSRLSYDEVILLSEYIDLIEADRNISKKEVSA